MRKDDRSRWYAPALSPEHLGEPYELRSILEPVALTKAATYLSPGFLEQLRTDLEKSDLPCREIRGPDLDRLEKQLHVDLLGHCDNRTLMQAIALPQSLLIAHRFLYRSTPELFETGPFLPEHMEIIENLEAGRIEMAALALEQHLLVSRYRALARVEVVAMRFHCEVLSYLERMNAD